MRVWSDPCTCRTTRIKVLTCERAEGLTLAHALSEAGISFYWRDGREDNEVPGEDGIALEVQSAQQARRRGGVRLDGRTGFR